MKALTHNDLVYIIAALEAMSETEKGMANITPDRCRQFHLDAAAQNKRLAEFFDDVLTRVWTNDSTTAKITCKLR